jgi:hypothetical protein
MPSSRTFCDGRSVVKARKPVEPAIASIVKMRFPACKRAGTNTGSTEDGGKTIANFWPAATTLFDCIRHVMPYSARESLTDQEVYALTAFLLSITPLSSPGLSRRPR